MINYNKIKTFKNVNDCFKVNSNSFSYFDLNNVFCVFDFNMTQIAGLQFETTALYREFGGDLYFSFDNKLVKLDCSDYSLKTVCETDKEYIVILNDNYDLFAVSEENGVYDNELLVRKNQEYISKWDVARNTSYYYNVNLGKILLFSSFNKLVIDCVSIESGKEIWNKEFKVKIQGDILVFKNVLIIPLANNYLLGIDARTGAQLWELDDCFFYYSLDSSRGLLYGYAGETFEVIDIEKGIKTLEKKFLNSEKQYGIAVSQHMHVVFEGDLYFSSNQYGAKFGKIDLNTYEIEFVQNVEVESGVQIDKPLCYSNHLYLLDTAKTLHIFEKV